MPKIYTKTGDEGMTSLGSRTRVPKDNLRVQAYGTVDELNAQIGVAIASGLDEKLIRSLIVVQNVLFNLGSDLSFPKEDRAGFAIPQVEERHLLTLEGEIDEMTAVVNPLKHFILPGGTMGAAQLHVARTVCRRAEREVITLAREEKVGEFVIRYLNRLSDALFVMARYENHQKKIPEPLWNSSS